MSKVDRIDQILTSLGGHDAIAIETRNIRDLLRSKGIKSDIFSEEGVVHGDTFHVLDYQNIVGSGNYLIHHFSIGSSLPYFLMSLNAHIITRYHNITPAQFFPYPFAQYARGRCIQGRNQIPIVEKLSSHYLSVSQYNANELNDFTEKKGQILPLIRNFDQLKFINPDSRYRDKIKKDNRKIILFVGRVVPNKAQYDLIFFLKQYYHHFENNVRLICIGNMDTHFSKYLYEYAVESGLSVSMPERQYGNDGLFDVTFTGGVNVEELVEHYKNADLFLCMSDHEGFCVPLVEAMSFGLPVIAHADSAVPETLGDGGILINKKNAGETLTQIYNLLNDQKMHDHYSKKAIERSKDFNWRKITQNFYNNLNTIIPDLQLS